MSEKTKEYPIEFIGVSVSINRTSPNEARVTVKSRLHRSGGMKVPHSYGTGWPDHKILRDPDLYKYLSRFR